MPDSLSGKVHKEVEDRFVLKALPSETKGVKPVIIRQGVLREVKNGDKIIAYARVRAYGEPGKAIKYSLGVKHFPFSQESETSISKAMFDVFYPDHLDKPQEKKRFILNKGWIVDQTKDGKIMAERERAADQKKSELPEGWKQMEKHAAIPIQPATSLTGTTQQPQQQPNNEFKKEFVRDVGMAGGTGLASYLTAERFAAPRIANMINKTRPLTNQISHQRLVGPLTAGLGLASDVGIGAMIALANRKKNMQIQQQNQIAAVPRV